MKFNGREFENVSVEYWGVGVCVWSFERLFARVPFRSSLSSRKWGKGRSTFYVSFRVPSPHLVTYGAPVLEIIPVSVLLLK